MCKTLDGLDVDEDVTASNSGPPSPTGKDDILESLYDSLDAMQDMFSLSSQVGLCVIKAKAAGLKRPMLTTHNSNKKRRRMTVATTKCLQAMTPSFHPDLEKMVELHVGMLCSQQLFMDEIRRTIKVVEGTSYEERGLLAESE